MDMSEVARFAGQRSDGACAAAWTHGQCQSR